jgi:hypothetical protein
VKTLLATFVLGASTLFCSSAAAQCTTGTYGQGCGPTLSATITPNGGTERISLTVNNAQPGALLLFALGFTELNLEIPGAPGCALLTDLVFSQFHQADQNGSYTYSRALPNVAAGPTIRIQFIEITLNAAQELVIRATNGATMSCQ